MTLEQDVGRLDVPVDHAAVVHVRQRLGQFCAEAPGFVGGEWAAVQPLRQALAVDQLHHEPVEFPGLAAGVVDADEVGVAEPGERGHLEIAPGVIGLVGVRLPEHLDRHLATKGLVTRPPDGGHAAAPEHRAQLVAPGEGTAAPEASRRQYSALSSASVVD